MDGTYCSVTLVGDSMAQTGSRARFAAYVDGERVLDEMISEKEMTFEIFSSEKPEVRYTIESIGDASDEVIETKIVTDPKSEKVTVTLIKLSEALHSTVGIKSIDVVSKGGISPTAEKDLKIEFIGDSLTCGYGVDDRLAPITFPPKPRTRRKLSPTRPHRYSTPITALYHTADSVWYRVTPP